MSCRSARAAAWRFAAISRSTANTVVKVESRAPARDADQIEITVDDERVQLASIEPAGQGQDAAAAPGAAARCRGGAADPLEVPHPGEGRSDGWSASPSSSKPRRATKRRCGRGCAAEGTQPALAA